MSITYKHIQFNHLAGTVHKVPFVPVIIPDEMRLSCTLFDSGAVVVEGFVYICANVEIFAYWWYP